MSSRDLIVAEIPRLRRYARALTGDAARADDLVQDTLERALSRFSLWRPGNLRAWHFTIMHNIFVNQIKSAANIDYLADELLPDLPLRATQSDNLELRDLDRALSRLSAEQREVLLLVGLEDISYIVQWSASYGIENWRLRAHVFILLNKLYAAPLLKQWLIQKNHEVPLLSRAMSLTKTGNSISWPLDVSACQNDKLIYIAPPALKGIKDPMAKTPRIQLVRRKHEKLALTTTINSSTKNRELTHKRIKELREEAGLPSLQSSTNFQISH
jgi:RNA polymerase sigma-70 factor (ECF subfamily)